MKLRIIISFLFATVFTTQAFTQIKSAGVAKVTSDYIHLDIDDINIGMGYNLDMSKFFKETNFSLGLKYDLGVSLVPNIGYRFQIGQGAFEPSVGLHIANNSPEYSASYLFKNRFVVGIFGSTYYSGRDPQKYTGVRLGYLFRNQRTNSNF